MQHQPKKIENQYQAQRKFNKIVRKYLDVPNGQVNYVENLPITDENSDDRMFKWALLLTEMRKDIVSMITLTQGFRINDPDNVVHRIQEFLYNRYENSDPEIKQIYDSPEMQQKIRVHLAFQAGRKKEFTKLMSKGKLKLSSESTALQPYEIQMDADKIYAKQGEKYFGNSAEKSGAEYVAESQNKQQELKIREAVLYKELIKFQKWIHETEIEDKQRYAEKLNTKLKSMSPGDEKIEHKAEERMAYQAGRKKEYFKLKMAGRLKKSA